jgi:5-methylcytosine-specific restriction protein A
MNLDSIIQLINEERFYKSRAWSDKRKYILQRDHYECQHCRSEGKYKPANTVHHIKHLDKHPELALDDDNLIAICEACHNSWAHPEKAEKFTEKNKSQKAERFPERW